MKTQYKIEVQDIFNLYGDEYCKVNSKTMSTGQYKAMRQIGNYEAFLKRKAL